MMLRLYCLGLRMLVPALVALLLAAVSYSFAASNAMPTTNAGDGSAPVGRYSISNIEIIMNTHDPAMIESVSFTLSGGATPGTLAARFLNSAGGGVGSWYDACGRSGSSWKCSPGGAPAYAQNGLRLRIVAAQ